MRAVKVTESNVMSASVIAAFSVFQAGLPSPVSRASFKRLRGHRHRDGAGLE